jgi:dipeptidase E
MPGTPFFEWPRPYVREFLGKPSGSGVFIAFAAVTFSFEEYSTTLAEGVFSQLGYPLRSVHTVKDVIGMVEDAAFIVVGGGNTFALHSRVEQNGLLDVIRRRLTAGVPYVGWSAGANLACPTIMTTNDMPIVQPQSLHALNLVPFQINPHYHAFALLSDGAIIKQYSLSRRFLVKVMTFLTSGMTYPFLKEGA